MRCDLCDEQVDPDDYQEHCEQHHCDGEYDERHPRPSFAYEKKPTWAEIGAMNQELQQLRDQLATEREKYQRLSDSETEQWEAYGAKLTNALKNALDKLDTVIFDERSILAEVRKILWDALQ